MVRTFAALVAATVAGAALADPDVVLATFDGKDAATTFEWKDQNDPVMGGASTSTFDGKVFNGTCAIVSFLKAPGFAKVASKDGKFADASAYIDGSMQLRVKSSTPAYKGFKLAFAADGVPKTSIFGGGSFKAGFELDASTEDWQVVDIPFNTFSYDWSGYTGNCDTKDPNGQQHHCCTTDEPKYCPVANYLEKLTDLEVWAEGVEGDFQIELDWIGASGKK